MVPWYLSGAGIAERVSALDWLSLHYAAIITLPVSNPRLVPLSKALYHTCFICGQRCKWWSRRPKLTSSVISDVKPIIYIFFFFKRPCIGHICKLVVRNPYHNSTERPHCVAAHFSMSHKSSTICTYPVVESWDLQFVVCSFLIFSAQEINVQVPIDDMIIDIAVCAHRYQMRNMFCSILEITMLNESNGPFTGFSFWTTKEKVHMEDYFGKDLREVNTLTGHHQDRDMC